MQQKETSVCQLGVRGELFVRVEVELIRDQHRFKHSSSEIKFFSGKLIPAYMYLYIVQALGSTHRLRFV